MDDSTDVKAKRGRSSGVFQTLTPNKSVLSTGQAKTHESRKQKQAVRKIKPTPDPTEPTPRTIIANLLNAAPEETPRASSWESDIRSTTKSAGKDHGNSKCLHEQGRGEKFGRYISRNTQKTVVATFEDDPQENPGMLSVSEGKKLDNSKTGTKSAKRPRMSKSPSRRKSDQRKTPGSSGWNRSLVKQATIQSFLQGSNDPTPRTTISNVLNEASEQTATVWEVNEYGNLSNDSEADSTVNKSNTSRNERVESSFNEESFLRGVNKEFTRQSPKLSQRDAGRRSQFVAGRKLTPVSSQVARSESYLEPFTLDNIREDEESEFEESEYSEIKGNDISDIIDSDASIQKIRIKPNRASRFVAGRKITPVITKVKSSMSDKMEHEEPVTKSKSKIKGKRSNSLNMTNTKSLSQKESYFMDASESESHFKKPTTLTAFADKTELSDDNLQSSNVWHKGMEHSRRYTQESTGLSKEYEALSSEGSPRQEVQLSPVKKMNEVQGNTTSTPVSLKVSLKRTTPEMINLSTRMSQKGMPDSKDNEHNVQSNVNETSSDEHDTISPKQKSNYSNLEASATFVRQNIETPSSSSRSYSIRKTQYRELVQSNEEAVTSSGPAASLETSSSEDMDGNPTNNSQKHLTSSEDEDSEYEEPIGNDESDENDSEQALQKDAGTGNESQETEEEKDNISQKDEDIQLIKKRQENTINQDENEESETETEENVMGEDPMPERNAGKNTVSKPCRNVALNEQTPSGYDSMNTPQLPGRLQRKTPALSFKKQVGLISSVKSPKNQREERIATRKSTPVTKKKKDPAINLSSSLTKSIFTHFCRHKVNKRVMERIDHVTAMYWKQTVSDLSAFAGHAGRTTVEEADVELLMKRQGFVTEKKTLYGLVEKYLPLEYRSEIIPILRANNKIEPKT